MKVLIAGCGYVGTALGARLAGAGHVVWGLRRNPAGLPDAIRPIAADLNEPRTLDDLPANLDGVVYAVSADASEPEPYRQAYVEGLRHLQEAAGCGSPRARLVFVSSTAVYGESEGELVDEASRPAPAGFRGETMLAAEKITATWAGPSCVVRASGIYGPGRDRLIRRVETGDVAPDPKGDRWTNRIHRDDLAAAIEHVLLRPGRAALYLASDRQPSLLSEVLRWIAERLDRTAGSYAAGGPPPDRAAGKRCVGRRLAEEGFVWRFPSFREGYGELLASRGADRRAAETP